MSMTTTSTKRRRVYERRFDHEAAQELHHAGWSYQQIADHCGVSVTAVSRVCDERQRARLAANNQRWINGGSCVDCGAAVSRLFVGHERRCQPCHGKYVSEQALLKRLNRDGDILCRKCGTHKPVDEFGWDRKTDVPRSHCKSCEAETRRLHRMLNREAHNAWERDYRRRRIDAKK